MRCFFAVILVGLLTSPAFCQGGKILFGSTRDGNAEIYVMDADGNGQTNLTNTPAAPEAFPAWREGAGRIVYQGNNSIWTMAPNGSGQTQILTGNHPQMPDYSPDGTKILYSAEGNGDYDLYTMSANGTNSTLLVPNQYGAYHGRWSPDGTKICFYTFPPAITPEIYVVNANGTGQTRLTFNGQNDYPDWSSDGTKIIYESGSGNNSEIYVMNANGTNPVRLTNNSFADNTPTFSPDGSRIAFSSNRDGNEEIYVMNADGTNQTRLTTNAASDAQPAWLASPPVDAPTINISDASLNESQGGTATLDFTVTLSAASARTITAFYSTANGTATASSDFTSSNSSVVFAPGDTSKTISVTVQNDALDEDDETLTVNVDSAINAFIGDGIGTGTIVDDDASPAVSISDAVRAEGSASSNDFPLTVTLSTISGRAVMVTYTTSDGTATEPDDYTETTGTVTIPAGSLSATFNIPVVGDTLREEDETFTVTLSTPINATLGDDSATATLVNDDFPQLSISGITLTEGDSGQVNAVFTVTLSETSPDVVTFDYATSAGTATSGTDFVATSGSGSLQPGETTTTISVPVNGDTLDEIDEGFSVTLSNLSKALPGTLSASALITDDDAPPTISITGTSQTEGNSGNKNFIFTISLSTVSGRAVSVHYETADNSALQPSDYTARSGNAIIAAGSLSTTVAVPVKGDLVKEPDETFTLTLSNPDGAILDAGQSAALGTIVNDDVVQLSITGSTVTEGNAGQVNAVFTVTIPETSPDTITFNYATSPSSATAGTDYTTTSGTGTITAGQTSTTINVPVIGDTLDENNESFFVLLSNPVNATLANNSASATITDDDASPTVSIGGVSQYEGNSGTTNFSFAVTLSEISGRTVSVNYATADGTATQPGDYTARTGTASILAGNLSTTITISVVGDNVVESDENFTLNLTGATNATLGVTAATGTIRTDDLPQLSVTGVTISEGNSGSKNAIFTIKLSTTSPNTVTFDFSTLPGTATAGVDYVTTTGSRTLVPGATQTTVSVPVKGDTVDELDETFFLQLSNPVNALLGLYQAPFVASEHFYEFVNTNVNWNQARDAAQARTYQGRTGHLVTITSDAEQNHINATLGITGGWLGASQVPASAEPGTFAWITGEPFTYTNWNGGEPNNADNGDVIALTSGNRWNDELRTRTGPFIVEYDLVPIYTTEPGRGAAVITDDDALPQISISPAQVAEGTGGSRDLLFTLSLTGATERDISVDFITAEGTAIDGDDYQGVNSTVIIPAGQSSVTVAVPIVTDAVIEDNETFLAQISNPANATLANTEAIGTIIDDDRTPSFSLNDVSVTETNGGSAQAQLTISLSSPSWKVITVSAKSTPGGSPEATPGSDYTALAPATITFNPGQTSKILNVTILGDTLDENDEKFAVTLSTPVNATIADGSGIVTILDNDNPPVITVAASNATEGNTGSTGTMTFTLKLSAASARNISVQYKTANATTFPATAGVDYTALGLTTVIIPAGQSTKTVNVTVKGDNLDEDNERIALTLSNPVNATLGTANEGVIIDDDASPSLSINDVSVTEGHSGSTALVFTVTLSTATARTVTVNVATGNGGSPAATAGSDYVALASTPLTFAPGQTSKQVSITINGDTAVEANEKLAVLLSGAVNASIADNAGIGTIFNDDAAGLSAPMPTESPSD